MIKKCFKCKEEKDISCFNVDLQKKDKRHSTCKDCLKKQDNKPNYNIEKICPSCKLNLPAEKFNKDRHDKTGLQVYCRECQNIKYKLLKYDLTFEQYQSLFLSQEDKCKICGEKPKKKKLHIDHNHKNNKVRGLLCYSCNSRFRSFL